MPQIKPNSKDTFVLSHPERKPRVFRITQLLCISQQQKRGNILTNTFVQLNL